MLENNSEQERYNFLLTFRKTGIMNLGTLH